MLVALVLAALGAETGADTLEREWQSLMLLRADPSRYRIVEQPLTLSEGPLSVTIPENAVLVPIFSGHTVNERSAKRSLKQQAWEDGRATPAPMERGSKRFVGFSFAETEASVTVSWVERADHVIFANHRVLKLGEPREALESVARGEPWTTTAQEGLVLSVDPQVEALFLGPDQDSDPFEVVVYGDKVRQSARQRAAQLVERRLAVMARAGLDAGRWIASDRVAVSRGLVGASGEHGLLDLHVDTNLGSLADDARNQPTDIDWLTALRDETGASDSRRRVLVAALDGDAKGRIIADRIVGVPFPPEDPADPLSPPVAPVRLTVADAFVDVLAVPRAADIEVELHARLKLTAVGGSRQWFELNIPRAGSPRAFEVRSIERLDGTPLLAETPLVLHDPVLTSRPEPEPEPDDDEEEDEREPGEDPGPKAPPPRDPYLERPESRVSVVLPEPLAAGESVVLDVTWRDVWPWAQVLLGGLMSAGEGSGLQGFLPRLEGAPTGNPSTFRVRVRTPARTRMRVAVSGETTRQWVHDEWNITEAAATDHPVPFANIAMSRFTVHDEPAQEGFPAIRTRILGSGGPMFAAETRRLIGFYEGYLPRYPFPEHEVFQAPSKVNGYVWIAAHEMTQVMTAITTGMMGSASLGRGGNVANRVFAHELAHQWWGHLVRPAHMDDFWLAETFAESFACMYMEAAFDGCRELMARKREGWERWEAPAVPRLSLTDAYSSVHQPAIVYDYGPLVFQQMLRPRLGHLGYHAALDVLMQDKAHDAVTTEQLQDFFARATKTELSDFFDFWVYGGFVPEQVTLDWRQEGETFVAEVTSDVPFGTFDVPVVLDDESEVWVVVRDGRGRVELPETRPSTVQLDPHGLILTRKRVVRGP